MMQNHRLNGGDGKPCRVKPPAGTDGKAWDALKELGVKTSDSKGNTRPVFTILKEMQASFEKNRLGTAQQAEYMKPFRGGGQLSRRCADDCRLNRKAGQTDRCV